MAIIQNKGTQSYQFPIIGIDGGGKDLELAPATNFDVNDELWESAKKNPICQILLEEGTFVELKNIKADKEQEIEGIPVADKKVDGQPDPIVKGRELQSTTKTNMEVDLSKK